MKDIIKNIISLFSVVTTGILFVYSLSLILFSDLKTVPASVLWQILAVGAITSVSYPVYYITRIPFKLRLVIAYLLTVAEVFQSAYIFRWFDFEDLSDYLILGGCVTVVYIMVFTVQYFRVKRCADSVNKMLKKRNKKE